MKAISPVLPNSDFPESVIAKDDPQYNPLPAAHILYADGTKSVISCYRLTFRERLRVLITGKVWWEQLTFGEKLQPQKMRVREPFTYNE